MSSVSHIAGNCGTCAKERERRGWSFIVRWLLPLRHREYQLKVPDRDAMTVQWQVTAHIDFQPCFGEMTVSQGLP